MRELRSLFANDTVNSISYMRSVCSAVIVPLLFASSALACSAAGCLDGGYEMRPTFAIFVSHAHKPLAGVNFHITLKGAEVFSGATDENGAIHAGKLVQGEYWLSGDLLGIGVVYTCFHVEAKPSRRAKSKLRYAWGDEAPATSRLAGTLIDSQPGHGGTPIWNLVNRADVPISGAELKLQDPISHAVYVTSSDQDGRFSYEGLSDGIYVLHMEGGSAGQRTYDATDQLIRLDARASRNWLLFKRRDGRAGSCGGTELELQNN